MDENEYELQWPQGSLHQFSNSSLQSRRKNKWAQILLGIRLENFSKFDLKNPKFYDDCSPTQKIREVSYLPSGNADMFIFDNKAAKTDICGSVSWQLYDRYKELNIRLVLTFNVPWKWVIFYFESWPVKFYRNLKNFKSRNLFRGSCDSGFRGNEYTIRFDDLSRHTKNEAWYKNYYKMFGRNRLSTACWAPVGQELVVKFNDDRIHTNNAGRAYATVHMDSTCAPMIKVWFFSDLDPLYWCIFC